jgi:hypothetical protein
MAWLAATPKPPRGSQRAASFDPDAAVSRHEQMRKMGVTPPMPPNPAPHLIDRFVEMGMMEAGGGGAVPLSWREIHYWQADTMVRLPPWEARLMRRLSVDYLAESRRAEDETCPAPWSAPHSEEMKRAELAILDSVLG